MAFATWRWWRRGKSASRSKPRTRARSAPPGVRQLETRLTPSLSTLGSFSGTNGADPRIGLAMDTSGNLYGTTELGGPSSAGAVFELAHGSATITGLATFNGSNGKWPEGGVIVDGSGNLYGTTYRGGASDDGMVFELAKGSGTITTLASFNGTNGANPNGGLIMDGSGNRYGTTSGGGASSNGTVFELAEGSGTITTLASFDGTDGASPQGRLLMDGSGNLYGTASLGGPSNDGTVFELAAGSGTITTLAPFDGTNGYDPDGSLIMDGGGNLYGTTFFGSASNDGSVFEVAAGSGTITTLVSFNGANGANPAVCGLVTDSRGDLYGTTELGGATNNGTVFELAPGSGTLTTLVAFNITDGDNPHGALLMDGSGDLYGTTYVGGPHNDGTVFELPGAAASTDQWTGANFAVDTNWSDGANWSLGAPPTGGETAHFRKNASVKDFTATVDAGFTSALGGLVIDSTWGGTITVDSALTVNGGFTMASGSLGGSGAVTVAGDAMDWTGGQIDVGSGGFTNTGRLKIDTAGGDLVLTGAGTLTNDGTITESGPHSLLLQNTATLDNAAGATFDWTGGSIDVTTGSFTNAGTLKIDTAGGNLVLTGAGTLLNKRRVTETGNGTLLLENGATLKDAKAGTYDIEGNGGIAESGGGAVVNAGKLEKSKGTGTSTIATSTLSNTGTVAVTSGTLDIGATVAQVSGSTLTGGTWTVTGSAMVPATLDLTSAGSLTTLGSGATVTLGGLDATFSNLSGLSTIDSGASFSLLGGQQFTTAGALTNGGVLTLGPGSVLTVSGSFTQQSAGTLTIEMGGPSGAPTVGQLVSTTGMVTLAGNLNMASTVVPAFHSSFELLDNEGNSAISGTFVGLATGATFKVTVGTTTMTLQITYTGTDADGDQNIIITRIS